MSHSYGQFATVYDQLMEDMPYADWLGFAREVWSRGEMPRTVVDLGCGTGNISIPLVRSGFDVYGIDISADMLSIARSKEDVGVSVLRPRVGQLRWSQQDMRSWELHEPVDSVISFCDCLNYLTEEEDIQAAFQATYAGLRDGGTFLFDVHPPSQLIRYAQEQPFVLDERDVSYIWLCDFDESRCEIEHNLTIFAIEDPKEAGINARYIRFEETHVQRAYDPAFIQASLQMAGFSKIEAYADFSLDSPDEKSERLFFVATK